MVILQLFGQPSGGAVKEIDTTLKHLNSFDSKAVLLNWRPLLSCDWLPTHYLLIFRHLPLYGWVVKHNRYWILCGLTNLRVCLTNPSMVCSDRKGREGKGRERTYICRNHSEDQKFKWFWFAFTSTQLKISFNKWFD